MSGSNIGTTVFIATGVPGTFDSTGYEALTWVKIERAEMVGSFSIEDSIIDVPDLETGVTRAIKGARAGTVVPIPYVFLDGDAGQAALKAAAEAREGEYSLKIVAPDGARVEAASGIAYSFIKNERSTTSYEGASAQFRTNYVPVEYTV